MRLKEDKSSWKAGGIIAKDVRNTKDEPKQRPHHKKKNTKDWCRGREGKPHEPSAWLQENGYYGAYQHTIRCLKCNKILNQRWKSFFRNLNDKGGWHEMTKVKPGVT
jgi:hypothetical protein